MVRAGEKTWRGKIANLWATQRETAVEERTRVLVDCGGHLLLFFFPFKNALQPLSHLASSIGIPYRLSLCERQSMLSSKGKENSSYLLSKQGGTSPRMGKSGPPTLG